MKNLLKISFLGLVIAAIGSTSVEASMLIDDFDDTQAADSTAVVGLPGFVPTTADRTLMSPLGGGFESDGAGLTALAFRPSPGGPDDFMVTWDDFGGIGGALDFTGGGLNNGFILGGLTYASSDALSALSLEIIVDDGSGPISTTIDLPAGFGPVDTFVPFSAFAGVDFSTIEVLTLDSSLPAGAGFFTFGLDSISVGTPEPSSLILCGFGLAAAGAYSYRRRRQTAKTNA